MTDTEWNLFVQRLVFIAGARRALELLDACPNARDELGRLERGETVQVGRLWRSES